MNEIHADESATEETSVITASHPGVEDGAIENGEKVVYEYDEDGALIGWHKEVTENR